MPGEDPGPIRGWGTTRIPVFTPFSLLKETKMTMEIHPTKRLGFSWSCWLNRGVSTGSIFGFLH